MTNFKEYINIQNSLKRLSYKSFLDIRKDFVEYQLEFSLMLDGRFYGAERVDDELDIIPGLTKSQMDIIFNDRIVVCLDCWYRAKSVDQAELHIKETGHRKGFESKHLGQLPYTMWRQGLFR